MYLPRDLLGGRMVKREAGWWSCRIAGAAVNAAIVSRSPCGPPDDDDDALAARSCGAPVADAAGGKGGRNSRVSQLSDGVRVRSIVVRCAAGCGLARMWRDVRVESDTYVSGGGEYGRK